MRRLTRGHGTDPVAVLLRRSDLRRLVAAHLLSSLGDGVALVAVAFAVLDATGSTVLLGAALAARYATLGAFLLLGGAFGDRGSRVRLMISADVARAVSQALLAAVLLTGSPSLVVVLTLQAVYGAGEAFFTPAASAVVPRLVPASELRVANGVITVVQSGSRVLGPAVGGLVVILGGAGGAIALDAVSFAVSALVLSRMRRGREPATPETTETTGTTRTTPAPRACRLGAEIHEGWAAVRGTRWLWVVIAVYSVYGALALPAMVVLGPVASWRGLGGAAGWSALVCTFGVGLLVGGLVATRLPLARAGVLVLGALVVAALRPLSMVVGWSLPAAAVASFLAGASLSVVGVVWATVLATRLPGHLLARVSGLDDFGTFVFTPLGYLGAAPLAAAIGLVPTMVAMSVVPAAACVAGLLLPDVRRLGGPEPVTGDGPRPRWGGMAGSQRRPTPDRPAEGIALDAP